MKHYAKVIEDNGGGLTLYIMHESDGQCVYAHFGYEVSKGQLSQDLAALIEEDSIERWEGNEPEMVAGWDALDIDGIGCDVIAEVADGKLSTYPARMGASGQREFGVSSEETFSALTR